MHDDTLLEPVAPDGPHSGPYAFPNDESPTARRISAALAITASLALLGNCLLTSPSRFSEKHYQDPTWLRPVVTVLGLGGFVPTDRGVEIRNLVFYGGAACLAILAGIRLMLATRSPRLSFDDLLDLRRRAVSPFFWWILLLLVSFFSSYYSHAPSMCMGQLIVRLLESAWWWPLATLLAARHVRGLSTGLVTALGLTAALGLWYFFVQVRPEMPEARLQYPIGNELWMGACMLPGIFVAFGLLFAGPGISRPIRLGATMLALALAFAALILTRSRSAQVGLAAGALAWACFVSGRMGRRVILLAGLLGALGGSFYVHKLVQEGSSDQRAHSIRSRLMYEWPYALHLFFQKPVAGNGDGAYAMLSGRFERDDQLEDPSTIRFDEWSWPGHAHNEFLELLSDLGIVGATAYLAAIAITLYRALRFCDRCPSSQRGERWLAIGLSAALVACAIEQCGDPAIREPGLPPIFLTVWAALWVIVRQQTAVGPTSQEGRRFPIGQVRLGGLAVCAAAILLGWYGIQDWRGARARFESSRSMDGRDYSAAIPQADFADEHVLDPFQRAQARMFAVWARSLAFDQALAGSPAPPTDAQMNLSGDAVLKLGALDHDVPRFLRVSRLAAELHLNRARAYERRKDKANEQDSQRRFISALMQNRKDEPFLLDRVQALWKVRPDAGAVERLGWLRCLMRAGEFGGEFVELFRTLPSCADFTQAMNDLFNVATQDATRTPDSWSDRLSPETLRAAALAKALAGSPEEAVKLAAQAQAMYARAGPRLFAAHSAAMHEQVRYRFAIDPLSAVDENLQALARAESLWGGSVDPSRPLDAPLGETRTLILVAAGREADAIAQIAKLIPGDPSARSNRLAMANAEVASRCTANPRRADEAIKFARRATELSPRSPAGHAALIHALLQSGHESDALSAAVRMIEVSSQRQDAAAFLLRLRNQYPGLAMWQDLQRRFPETTSPTTSRSAD